VTEGEGRFQSRGHDIVTIRPGDIIRIASAEEHWHGAGPNTFMTHLAVTEGETVWADPVTDDEYGHGQP
jgi:quercetin dioxygenase-like cupin family protein